MRSKLSRERGQALIIIAFALIALVGMVGLAIDGGAKFSDRRHAQNAADTAALAAALAKVDALIAGVSDNSPTTNAPTACPPPSGVQASPVCDALQLAGLDRATSNGYSGNLTSNTVKIYSPPISGYYSTIANSEDYVQVIIDSNVNTTFSRVFGFNQFNNHVEAVALAKPGYNLTDGAMIISYDPDPNCSTTGTGGYSVSVSGNSTVNLNGGGIFLNSDEVCGFTIPNCADLNIFGGSVNSVATVDNIDTGSCVFDPPLTEKIDQTPVDLDNIDWPPVPKECSMAGSPTPTFLGMIIVDGKEVEEWLIYPGFYTEFPQATLLPTAEEVSVGKRSRIYMQSGVYCIDPPMNQDLSWSPIAASLLNGSTKPSKNKFQDPGSGSFLNFNPDGVTLYIRSGGGFTINLNNASPTFLDATKDPDSDYQGYLIVLEGDESSIEACEVTGGANIDINGLIFAPFCDITVNGGSSPTAEINAQLIGWDIKINGTTTVNFNYNPSNQVVIKRRVGLMK